MGTLENLEGMAERRIERRPLHEEVIDQLREQVANIE